MNMNSWKTWLRAPVFLMAAACSSGAHLAPPSGFAELEASDNYSYRATSAAGVVIGVRTEENRPHGNLEFWKNALDLKLKRSGYAPLPDAETKVSSNAGLEGRRLGYQISKDSRIQEYWLTVFVTDRNVIVVEAAGDGAFFDANTKKQIEAATATVSEG